MVKQDDTNGSTVDAEVVAENIYWRQAVFLDNGAHTRHDGHAAILVSNHVVPTMAQQCRLPPIAYDTCLRFALRASCESIATELETGGVLQVLQLCVGFTR